MHRYIGRQTGRQADRRTDTQTHTDTRTHTDRQVGMHACMHDIHLTYENACAHCYIFISYHACMRVGLVLYGLVCRLSCRFTLTMFTSCDASIDLRM